jgi:hypothetical protein
MYLALKCKPDNGTEIQNLANVALGIMIRLKIVRSAKEENALVRKYAHGHTGTHLG